MTSVIAFHGQAASGGRLRADMGDPAWVDWYPDWQREFTTRREDPMQGPMRFARHYVEAGFGGCVLVGYSLGGDFICRLTYTPLAPWIEGIIVYESPVLYRSPNALGCPVTVIWNDYEPKRRKRRDGKAKSIAAWTTQFSQVQELVGKHTTHMLYSQRRPIIRHAWDKSLNPLLCEWIENATAARL